MGTLLLFTSVLALAQCRYEFKLLGQGRCLDSNDKPIKRYGAYYKEIDTCEDKCKSVEPNCKGISYNSVLRNGQPGPPGYCSVYAKEKPEKMNGPFDKGKLKIAKTDNAKNWKCYKAVRMVPKEEEADKSEL